MRKTLSTIVLVIGLVIAVAPAYGDDGASGPAPSCTDASGQPASCPGAPCIDASGQPCDPTCAVATSAADGYRLLVVSQQSKIARQAKIIKRLRHRLAVQ